MKVKALVMTCDEPNRNGRIYRKDMILRQVEEFKKRIEREPVLGEFEPNQKTLETLLRDVSHKVLDIWMEGKDVYADIEILQTPKAQMIYAFGVINHGCELIGTCESINEETKEVEGFILYRIDLVRKEECAWEKSMLIPQL